MQPQGIANQGDRRSGRDVEQHLNVLAEGIGGGNGGQRLHQLVELERRLFQLQPPGFNPGKVEDVAQDIEQGVRRKLGLFQIVALKRREFALSDQVDQPHDRVHRGADLVAHVGEELGLGPTGLLGLISCCLQRPFVVPVLGDVLVNSDHHRGLAGVIPLDQTGGPDGPDVPRRCGDAEFGIERGDPGQGGGDFCLHAGDVVGMAALAPRLVAEGRLFGLQAVQFQHPGIPDVLAAVGIPLPDADSGGAGRQGQPVGECFEFPLALPDFAQMTLQGVGHGVEAHPQPIDFIARLADDDPGCEVTAGKAFVDIADSAQPSGQPQPDACEQGSGQSRSQQADQQTPVDQGVAGFDKEQGRGAAAQQTIGLVADGDRQGEIVASVGLARPDGADRRQRPVGRPAAGGHHPAIAVEHDQIDDGARVDQAVQQVLERAIVAFDQRRRQRGVEEPGLFGEPGVETQRHAIEHGEVVAPGQQRQCGKLNEQAGDGQFDADGAR